ncbi:MAG: hypothetical protein GX432_13185 [Candidatus Atribacteria bacterium]|nr:hypothetical protein [Candidatus Atribacteria bacterium]
MFKKKIRNEVVYIANGLLEAETVKLLLNSFGIEAFINQESAGISYGLTTGPLAEAEITVAQKDIQDAKMIIEKMNNGYLEENK